jgi:outer membrane protein assembly factor BamD
LPPRAASPLDRTMTRFHATTRRLLPVLILAFAFAGGGCSSLHMPKLFGHHEEKTETLPVEQLYATAHEQMVIGNMGQAQTTYKRLISRFPYGPYTEQSQLDLAYAQYKDGKYDDASSTVDRFIRTYPSLRHADYAYYM